MIYSVRKQMQKEHITLLFNRASDKAFFKVRTIWRLATKNLTMKKVSDKRLLKAKDLYNAVKREWYFKDQELENDSHDTETAQKRARAWSVKDDKQLEKIKKLCKELGLFLMCGTWSHIYQTKNGEGQIM